MPPTHTTVNSTAASQQAPQACGPGSHSFFVSTFSLKVSWSFYYLVIISIGMTAWSGPSRSCPGALLPFPSLSLLWQLLSLTLTCYPPSRLSCLQARVLLTPFFPHLHSIWQILHSSGFTHSNKLASFFPTPSRPCPLDFLG